jgi:malic enzyme
MRQQLEAHLKDDANPVGETYNSTMKKDMIELIVVTDSEAILGIGGEKPANPHMPD